VCKLIEKQRARFTFSLLICMDKFLNYKDKIFAVAPMMDWTDSIMLSITKVRRAANVYSGIFEQMDNLSIPCSFAISFESPRLTRRCL